MSTVPARTVLVTGATGRVGRHVVDGLLARAVHVRALTRSPETAGLPESVDVVPGDLAHPETVAAAAASTDAAFLLWPGFSPDGSAEVVQALARHVPHLVYLSAARLRPGEDGPTAGVWADIEQQIEAAGPTWTFVRGGGFAANTLEWAEQVRSGGDTVRLPYPDSARSLVHEQDLADVIVKALVDRRHAGRSYAVTGPETLTQRDQVRAVGEALGRDLAVRELTPQEFLDSVGPEASPYYETALPYWASLVAHPERTTDDVARVTGRPARSFARWARDHAADFVPTCPNARTQSA